MLRWAYHYFGIVQCMTYYFSSAYAKYQRAARIAPKDRQGQGQTQTLQRLQCTLDEATSRSPGYWFPVQVDTSLNMESLPASWHSSTTYLFEHSQQARLPLPNAFILSVQGCTPKFCASAQRP